MAEKSMEHDAFSSTRSPVVRNDVSLYAKSEELLPYMPLQC